MRSSLYPPFEEASLTSTLSQRNGRSASSCRPERNERRNLHSQLPSQPGRNDRSCRRRRYHVSPLSLLLSAPLTHLHSNNTLRAQLSSSFSQSTISAIVDDPTAIWRPSARGTALFDLAQGEKDQVIRAYVKGFQTLFQVYIGLVGLNLCVPFLRVAG